MKELGPKILDILRVKGLEQKDLAEAIGISEQTMGVLLKKGTDRWKLSYFLDSCRYLHIHPISFFREWGEGGNTISGNVENNAIHGTSNLSLISGNYNEGLETELRARLRDKDDLINSLNEIIALQKQLLKNSKSDDKTL